MIKDYRKIIGEGRRLSLCIFALKICCFGIMVFFGTTAAHSEQSCEKCHQKEAELEKGSVHKLDGILCADCHGGNASAMDKDSAMSKSSGFRGKIKKADIPELCGNCHSDVRRMNPYGLPTDQLAQYKTSHHGEALYQKGDTHVATCADCHHSHGILDVKNPASPVYPTNVPSTCGRCHSNPELMQHHGLETNQEALYRQSIHAQMLFEKKDLSAPTCVTCHGNHGAVPPGFSQVGLVCGKCHIKQKEYFDQSPHSGPAKEGYFETCVTCHSNHRVVPATEKIFSVCNSCHSDGDKAYIVAGKIKAVLADSEKAYSSTKVELEKATQTGFDTENEQALLAEVHSYLLQLYPLQHTLDLRALQAISEQVTNMSKEINSMIAKKARFSRYRKLALIPLGLFLIFMSIGFHLKKKEIQKRRKLITS